MENFIWQDLLTLFAVIVGAVLSARRIPDFPNDSFIAKFALGLHVTVVVAIFSTMANPAINIWNNVDWVFNMFKFNLPLLVYAIIISMGMALLLNSTFQTVLISVHSNNMKLIPTALLMSTFDMFILIHLMCIF